MKWTLDKVIAVLSKVASIEELTPQERTEINTVALQLSGWETRDLENTLQGYIQAKQKSIKEIERWMKR